VPGNDEKSHYFCKRFQLGGVGERERGGGRLRCVLSQHNETVGCKHSSQIKTSC
jgi:hypothetical protein